MDYELQAQICSNLSEKMFTDLSLCQHDNFLVGSHTEGVITVFNLEQ